MLANSWQARKQGFAAMNMREDELTQTDAEATVAVTVSPRRISWDIGVQLVGRVANLALGVVVTALLARALGESGFGV